MVAGFSAARCVAQENEDSREGAKSRETPKTPILKRPSIHPMAAFLLSRPAALLSRPAAPLSRPATSRFSPSVLRAGDTNLWTVVPWAALANMDPMNIVEAQLACLQDGDVAGCYHLASPGFRRAAGSVQKFEQVVRDNPEYKPLVGCTRYRVISTLQVGPRRWRCRVRVENVVGRIPFAAEYHWDVIQQSEAAWSNFPTHCLARSPPV